MFEEGLRLFQYGRFEQCLSVLGVVLHSDPDHQEALRLSGAALLVLGRPREAIAPLRRAARHSSSPVEVLLSLAQAFEALDRPAAAALALHRALREHPGSLTAREEYARILVRLGRGVAAEVAARQALHDSDGQSANARLALGCALYQQRRLADALHVLGPLAETAGQGSPTGLSALTVVGRIHEHLGDRAAAAKAFATAAGRMPHAARLNLHAARLLLDQGKDVPAKRLLQQAEAAATGQPGLLVAVADLYLKAGAPALALRAASAAADLPRPNRSFTLNLTLARCHQALGDYATAERHLGLALRLRRTSLAALLARAEGRLAMNLPAKAANDATAILALHPDHLEAGLLLGKALFLQNRFHEALSLLRGALNDGASADAAMLLGQALYRTGKSVEAVKAFEVAEQRDPALADLDLWLRRARTTAALEREGDDPFRFRHQSPQAARPPGLVSSLHEHMIVVSALMQRQARVRFGHRKLGYLAAILQPLVGLALMMFFMTVIRNRQPGDMPLALFLMTGLVAWQVFNSVWGSMERASRASQALLVFPRVTPFDVRVALLMFDFITEFIILVTFSVILLTIDFEVYIENPLQVLAGVGVLFLLATGVGMITEVLSSFWRIGVQMARIPLNRILFLTSGIFFSAHDLPPALREYALFNPLLHVIEYIRNGAETSFPLTDANIEYPIAVGMILLLTGLVLESRFRARLLGQ